MTERHDIESGNYHIHQSRIRAAHRFAAELEDRVKGDLRKTAKNYLVSTAGSLIAKFVHSKMRGAKNLGSDMEVEASPAQAASGTQRKRSAVEVVTDAEGNTKVKRVVKTSPANVSSLVSDKGIFDGSLVPALGEQRLTGLRMHLGKKLYPDNLKSFLAMCLGNNAKTRTSFAGRMQSALGERHYHHQIFRHNYSENDTTVPSAYGAAILPRILQPVSNLAFNANPSVVGAPDTSFRDMNQSYCYYSVDNRTDLEDMSWNQSRIKLAGEAIGASGNIMTLQQVAPLFKSNQHARISQLSGANSNDSTFASGNRAARGRFKAVFNYGKLTYNFMNKGEGSAEVIVMVSKFKKNHMMSSVASDYANGLTFPMANSIAAIGQGWVNTQASGYSTEDYNGRRVSPDDVQNNPCFPFLPQLKKTRQGEVDICEISRQTFAMPSGSRREVVIDLPGIIYDPQSLPVPTGLSVPSGRGIVDEYTYAVTLACNGTRSTRFVDWAPSAVEQSTGYAVGDIHGPSNIQFYATYEEGVGPCIYSAPKVSILANDGGLKDPTDEFTASSFKKRSGLIVPQSSAVRSTPMVVRTYNSAGTLQSTTLETPTATCANESNERR